ncbi:hypothetical protein [Listeria ilorinensis]|uniref:hypothetical protein n=1 Tax=Listeria ilorinensis TaxID=2867439 RepID=UPI001EF63E4F|nr:hypothetical protein [Listeria ilorinensis]
MKLEQSINAEKPLGFVTELMQKEIADCMRTSRQNVSHMINGRRQMQIDVAKQGLENIDNNLFMLSVSSGFTKILPDVFSGEGIAQSPLSFAVHFDREAQEFSEVLSRLFQLLAMRSQERHRLEMREIMYELLDVLGWGYNLLCYVAEEMNFNVADLMKERSETWKEEKFI